MELFTVNRHTENENSCKSENNEDEILRKLLQTAEKRKNQAPDNMTIEPDVKTEETFKQKKRRKSKKKSKNVDEKEKNIECENASFQVLGHDVVFEKKKVDAIVLPPWLAHPTIISTSIAALGDFNEKIENLTYLEQHIKNALKQNSIEHLFPVQKAVIPWILEAHTKPWPFRPRDICVSAPTGSGKTLAFAIPIVQLLAQSVQKKVRALVVLPVAELAKQIHAVFEELCKGTRITAMLLSNKTQFQLEQEKLVDFYQGHYYSKVDIIITTPGRLVDHLHSTQGFCLKSLKFLVIDEADRIMDTAFYDWLYHLNLHLKESTDTLLSGRTAPLSLNELEKSANTQPHKLLFSATLSQDPEKLQNLGLFQPKLFTSVMTNLSNLKDKMAIEEKSEKNGEFIGKFTTPAELTEKYCITESTLKPLTLYSLIKENGWTKFLCFTNSKGSTARLAFVLHYLFKKELRIEEISSALTAKQRSRALARFARGTVNGLICSDALARGIDIPNVDYVISYDAPHDITTYIHRIGRTARAGRKGTAITLLTPIQQKHFNKLLANVGKKVNEEITVSLNLEEENAQQYSMSLQKLRQKLKTEKESKILHELNVKKGIVPKTKSSQMTFAEKLQYETAKKLQEFTEQETTPSFVHKKKLKKGVKLALNNEE